MFFLKAIKQLKKYKIPYAIVGGQAVALHGAVRGTLDIDFILKWNLKNLELTEKAFAEINLQSRLPITANDLFKFKNEYIKNKNLIAWNFINPLNPAEQIDIIITTDLTGKSIKKMKVKNEIINILSKKDLIKMKKIAGRDQDLIDIEALEKLDEK